MARKKTDEEKEYHVLLENVRELLKSGSGKRVIWYILSFCDIYSDTFTGDRRVDYLTGRRGVGLSILQLLEDADPTAYPRLLLENTKKEGARHGTNRTSNADDGDDGDDSSGGAGTYDFGDNIEDR